MPTPMELFFNGNYVRKSKMWRYLFTFTYKGGVYIVFNTSFVYKLKIAKGLFE